MAKKSDADKARNSSAFKKAKSRADSYKNDPDKLRALAENAQKKASKHKSGALKEVCDSLISCFRLLKAYASGSYREIPWDSLALIIASAAYFLMPVDLIPDFIPVAGYLDDAALLAWTIKSLKIDIDNFLAWEAGHA